MNSICFLKQLLNESTFKLCNKILMKKNKKYQSNLSNLIIVKIRYKLTLKQVH